MKKTIIIIPFLLLLLLSSSLALLEYDSREADVVTGNIRGLQANNDTLYVSSYVGTTDARLYKLDTDFNQIGSYTSTAKSGLLSYNDDKIYSLAVNDVMYVYNATDYSYIESKTTPLSNSFSLLYTDNGFLVGQTNGEIDVYDYDTNTITTTHTIQELADISAGITHLASIGANYYVGGTDNFVQVDNSFNVIETLTPVQNLGTYTSTDFRLLKGFNSQYVFYLNDGSYVNDLFILNSTAPASSNYRVIDGVYYNKYAQCIDTGSENDYIFCSNATFQEFNNYVGVYCNSASYETACEGICETSTETINGSTYISGECDTQDCTNECFTTGTAVSTGLTTYRVCGNYDNDICLEYGSVQTCDSGSYFRLDASAVNPYCADYNYSSFDTTFLNSDWYMNFDKVSTQIDYSEADVTTFIKSYLAGMNLLSDYSPLTSDDNQYFKSRYLTNAYDVATQLNNAYTSVGLIYPDLINESGYASVVCDYKETPITQRTDTETLNTSRTLTTSVNKNIVDVSFTYTLNDTDDMRFIFNRVSPSLAYVLDLNVTNNTFYAYSDNELIFNQTTADNIEVVNVLCDFDFTNKYRGCYIKITAGANTYEVYETPVNFNSSRTPTSSYISLTPSDSIELKGYSVTEVLKRSGFTNVTEGTYPFTCEILEGGQIIRMYQNNGEIPSYLDFQDAYLNVDLGTLTTTQDETKTGLIDLGEDVLTNQQKIIISLLLSVGMFIMVLALTSKYDVSTASSSIIGAIASIGMFLFFTIIGWLPLAVAIVAFIIAGGIGAIFIRKQIVGA